MKWICLIPLIFSAARAQAFRQTSWVDLHVTVQMKACYPDSSCSIHSFGGGWIEVGLKELPNEFDIPYFTGEAEVSETYAGHTFVTKIFLEHWPRSGQYRLSVKLFNAKFPEQPVEISMWIDDIRDFTRFALSGFAAPDGDRRVMPHLELGPRYRTESR